MKLQIGTVFSQTHKFRQLLKCKITFTGVKDVSERLLHLDSASVRKGTVRKAGRTESLYPSHPSLASEA